MTLYRCTRCRRLSVMRPVVCRTCWNEDVEKVESEPVGVVDTFTVVRRGLPGVETPYVLAWATFPDLGMRVFGRVVDPAGALPQVAASTAVRLVEEPGAGVPYGLEIVEVDRS